MKSPSEVVRRRLPNRREHDLLDLEHGSFHYVAGIGRFDDGGLESGARTENHAGDAAIVASIVDTVRHALPRNGALGALLDLLTGVAMSAALAIAERHVDLLDAFAARADARAMLWSVGEYDLHTAVDKLQSDAEHDGLVDRIGQDAVQKIIADAFLSFRKGADV